MPANNPAIQQVLVTGGGGFLGSALCQQLLAKGYQVTSLARNHYSFLEELGVKQVQGSLCDRQILWQALQEKQAVFHVAAKAGIWGKYQDYYQSNYIGTKNLVDLCKQQGIGYFIYTSSPSVVFNGSNMKNVDESVPYPDHYKAHYPKTKALAEAYVRNATDENFLTASLRPHLIWGPKDNHLVPRILKKARQLRQVGSGENLVDSVYIDNAAHAHVLALEALLSKPEISGRVYFISQGEPRPLWELVNLILQAGGKPPVTKKISARTAYAVGAMLEFIYTVLPLQGEPPMTRFLAEELATDHWFDLSAASRDLGYRAEVSIEEGMKRLRGFLQEGDSF